MSTPTNIPETPMGETEHDSYLKPEEKFKQQLQDIFQTILRVNKPDQFDQLCQWMEYKQFQTFDDFYDFYCSDSEKLDAKNPEAEYKWKGKTNYLSANVAHNLKSFVQWMAHEKRPHDLHDDYLSTLTRENYFNFRFLCTQSPTLPPSHHEPYKHQVKKRPQRKAFFPQQEGISDDDENTNEEEQFSTDQEPEEPSPYSVYQSSSHPKMPQKSFLPPNIWGTPPESTKQMIIEHNKKVKLNNPTPYLSGSKTKPNPPLGKPTPTSKQVHQHSQDEPTGESKYQTPSESLTALNNFKKGTKRDASALPQFLTHHNCDDLDPTDTPSAVPTALQAPSDGDQPDDIISYNQLMEYLEDKTDTGPLVDGLHRLKCIKDHKGPYTSSEVDWGGHDPYNNHVNESLLSEVDWGAHNPYADDPEQLTGESIQSFLTSVIQLQWLVTLGRLVTHAQVTTLSKLVVASS